MSHITTVSNSSQTELLITVNVINCDIVSFVPFPGLLSQNFTIASHNAARDSNIFHYKRYRGRYLAA